MSRKALQVLFVQTAFLVASAVAANPLDTFGYGSREAAMGSAATAFASSHEAAYYNPAGLAGARGPEFGVGLMVFRPFLDVNGQGSAENTTGYLLDVGVVTPIPLGRGLDRVLFAGVGLAFPGTTLYAIRERSVEEPSYPFFGERNRRLVLNMALAGRPHRMVSIGLGVSLLPNVKGDVAVDFSNTGSDNSTSVDAEMSLAPNAGLVVEPVPGLTFGLSYRGADRTELEIPVSVVLSDNVAPVRLEVDAIDYSTPHEISFGAAWDGGSYLVAVDFTYFFYRWFVQSAPTVLLFDPKGGVTQESRPPDAGFHDSVAVRTGVEWRPAPAWAVRAGFRWVQSPVPAQRGPTNLLDGDRFTGSVGAGFDASGVGGPRVRVDLHAALTGLVGNGDAKMEFIPNNPGYPSIESGGVVLDAGITLKVGFGDGGDGDR